MITSAPGFAHPVSQIFLTENNEPSPTQVGRLLTGEAERGSIFIPRSYNKIVLMRHYTVKGLIKFQQNMPRQEFSKSYKKPLIHYTEQVRNLVFVTCILERHLVRTRGPEIMISNPFWLILLRQQTFHTIIFVWVQFSPIQVKSTCSLVLLAGSQSK